MNVRAGCFCIVALLNLTLGLVANGQVNVAVKTAREFNGAQRIAATRASGTAVNTTVQLEVTAPAGYTNVTLTFGLAPSIDVTNAAIAGPHSVSVPVNEFDRDITLSVSATGANQPLLQTTGKLYVDSKSPVPLSPVVERFPGGSATIRITFAENDLDPGSVVPDAFRIIEEIQHTDGTAGLASTFAEGDPIVEAGNRSVLLNFRNLNPGNHWIVIDKLKDVVGNTMIARSTAFDPKTETAKHMPFTVPGGQLRGEQVEYPRFLRPRGTESEFDPGDRVDTRVLQLYYFRDARLVAEYINRNIQDLNQSGYDEAQRFAQQARAAAEDKIDERRFKETMAVEAARSTREVQHQLDEAREQLNKATQRKAAITIERAKLENAIQVTSGADSAHLQASIDTTKSAIVTNADNIDTSAKKLVTLQDQLNAAIADEKNGVAGATDRRLKLEAELAAEKSNQVALRDEAGKLQNKLVAMNSLQANAAVLTAEETKLTTETAALNAALAPTSLPKQLMEEQAKEITDRNAVVRAEASELRAAQEQFRREVAAGMADRNSYAKGNPFSVDPVTQVTISVVGTSRLQVRGPIKGVNKIARMVHQLDSPVGQVKLGIHTVQVNGEHGDRMDFVYERINQEIAHSRFLVSTSSQLLRRAVHEVAAEVALAADEGYLPDGCPPELTMGVASLNGAVQTTPEQRDRRYLYAFFGSDFISELEEMDSELLNTENKLLSIHSMDTVSLAGALFVMAHADHPVRQRIVVRFQELLAGELPQREMEYVQALTHVTPHGKSLQNRFRKASKIDNKNAAEIYFNAARTYHFPNTISYFNDQVPGQGTLNPVQYSTVKLAQALKAQLAAEIEYQNLVLERSLLETRKDEIANDYQEKWSELNKKQDELKRIQAEQAAVVRSMLTSVADVIRDDANLPLSPEIRDNMSTQLRQGGDFAIRLADVFFSALPADGVLGDDQRTAITFRINQVLVTEYGVRLTLGGTFIRAMDQEFPDDSSLKNAAAKWAETKRAIEASQYRVQAAEKRLEPVKKLLFSKRLLDQFMDDQEEKSVELMEALRSHSSNVDNYLKRLAIAVEDDVAAQFYEPAFQRIRRVSRTYDVTLGQIETTTVLTNNRTLAKVSPAASFEFDLPQRDILLTEALNGSKALADEYGNLLKDGTFLAGTAMLSGQPPAGIVGSNAPIQGIPGLQRNQEFGSDLQKLIPDPAIYKFETGTGFEIQPVIQPDGHSIVYGFDYMYSTNVREPVRADEKHLGRIKRHFVHTDVQTSSYELREISRYTVALKASRTDRGVPLLEDLPGVGAAFRPLPSEESSLQTNIILGSSTIYPTVFDLMGLRWSHHVDSIASTSLSEQKDEQVDRRKSMRDQLLRTTRDQVDQTIGLPNRLQNATELVPPGYRVQ